MCGVWVHLTLSDTFDTLLVFSCVEGEAEALPSQPALPVKGLGTPVLVCSKILAPPDTILKFQLRNICRIMRMTFRCPLNGRTFSERKLTTKQQLTYQL